jgi:Type II secretion system (T2SS), protein N
MPTSPLPRRDARPRAPAAPARSFRPFILALFVLTGLAVAVVVLPASLVAHFLPAAVHAEDFSGSVWHGSAGRITVNGRDAGALEWHLHSAALLRLHLVADLHWVKGGFVIDGTADAQRGGLMVSNIQGGGPIEDLRDFGLSRGWRGTAQVQVKELKAVFSGAQASVRSALGDIAVSDLTSPQVAAGADLGGYSLHFADTAIAPDSDATAELTDTGGPLALDAVILFSVKERRGTLTGTVKERADAPAALHGELDDLAQLHARDTQGRIPLDLEFTL